MDNSLATQRFLVVDDCEDSRFIVSRLVRRAHPHASVQVACDGSEALAMLRDAGEGDGVVIFCDYDMGPGPTGTQVLAEVAQRHPRARRVLLTGHAPDRIVRVGIEPDTILSKDGGMRSLREFLAPAL